MTYPYTRGQVARIVGWMNKTSHGTWQPNNACKVAFQGLELAERGLLDTADVRGLNREQLAEIVRCQWAVFRSHEEEAEIMAAEAKKSRVEGKEARARAAEDRAQRAQQEAQHNAKTFATNVAKDVKAGKTSVRDIRHKAAVYKRRLIEPQVKDVDGMIDKDARCSEQLRSRRQSDGVFRRCEETSQTSHGRCAAGTGRRVGRNDRAGAGCFKSSTEMVIDGRK